MHPLEVREEALALVAHGLNEWRSPAGSASRAARFPQHGPGKKHQRWIEFEGWQCDLLDRCAWAFIKACIRTDGCALINTTHIHQPEPNQSLRYCLSNQSEDIIDLFLRACDQVGVRDDRPAYTPRRGIRHVDQSPPKRETHARTGRN